MSNFSNLIATIQANIKQNGHEDITGEVLQEVLLAMVDKLGTNAINDLESSVSTLSGTVSGIEGKIPSAATSSNKLTDKAYVDAADTTLTNAVNAIEDAIENGYVYAGIATPSGTPASGKVFYLALTAGTYTNYGGLVVTQGINILKYDGTDWLQEQLIGIDNEPISGSHGLTKSGGVAKNTFGKDLLVSTTLTEDTVISSVTGLPVSNQYTVGYACTDFLPVKYGDIIRFAFVKGVNLCGGCTYDINHNKIGVIWGTDDGSTPSEDVNKKGFQFVVDDKEVYYVRYNLVDNAIFPRDMQYVCALENTMSTDLLEAEENIRVLSLKQNTPGGIICKVVKRGVYDSSLSISKLEEVYNIIEIDLSYVKNSVTYSCSLDRRNAGLPVIVGMSGGNIVAMLVSNSSGSEAIEVTLQKSTLISAGYDTIGISTMSSWGISVDGLLICNDETILNEQEEFSYFVDDSFVADTINYKSNKFVKVNLTEGDGNGYNVLKTLNLDGITDFIAATVFLSGSVPLGFLMNSDGELIDYIYINGNGYQDILIDLNDYNGLVSYILWNTYGLTSNYQFYEIKILRKAIGYKKYIEKQNENVEYLSENVVEHINVSPYYTDGYVKADGTYGNVSGYNVYRIHDLKGKTGRISMDIYLAGTVRKAILLDENDNVIGLLPANDGGHQWNNVTIDLSMYNGEVESILFNTYDVSSSAHQLKTNQWYIVTPKKAEKIFTVSTTAELVNAIRNSANSTIYVNEGTYNIFDVYTPTSNDRGLYLQDNSKLIGLGNKENVIINGTLPNDASSSVMDINSVLNVVKNCKIKNIKITGTNVRYCVHSDNGEFNDNEGKGTTIIVENCIFIHNGINVETTNNNPCAWGMGLWSGCKRIFRNCYFEGNNAPGWACHNQLNQEKPSYVLLENCQFVNKNRDVAFQTGDFKKERCIGVGSVGNHLGDVIEIKNCSGNAYLWHIQNDFSGGTNIGLDYLIKGGGNILLPVKFHLTTGTAYDDDYLKYAHTEFADEGGYYIADGGIVSGDLVVSNSVAKVEKTTNFASAIGLSINDAVSGNKLWVINRGYVPVASLGTNLNSNVGDIVSYSGGVWSNSNSGNVFVVKRKGFIFVDFTQ